MNPGDTIILLYEDRERREWQVQGIFRVLDPGPDRIDDFPAIGELPVDDWYLEAINYRRDPVLNRFVGFHVEVDACEGDEEILETSKFRRSGQNAIEPYLGHHEEHHAQVTLRDGDEATTSQFHAKADTDVKWPVGKRFLGIDVGFSEIKPSLGYCCLEVNEEGIQIDLENSGLQRFPDFRDSTLPNLLKTQDVSVLALDGPLTPEFHTSSRPRFRPQERYLKAREIPRRIKAQPYKSPIGSNLYQAAMVLRFLCEDRGWRYASFGSITPRTERLILEAFPKLWLALLLNPDSIDEEAELNTQRRSLIDYAMAVRLFGREKKEEPSLEIRLQRAGLSLRSEQIGRFVEEDKDQACAFASAMTALLVYIGWGSILGNESMGSFALPAPALWHEHWRERVTAALQRFRVDEGGPLEFREVG